jgi:hypothetical protein
MELLMFLMLSQENLASSVKKKNVAMQLGVVVYTRPRAEFPTAYPCPQVRDIEFGGYDVGKLVLCVISARLSYADHEGGRKFAEY